MWFHPGHGGVEFKRATRLRAVHHGLQGLSTSGRADVVSSSMRRLTTVMPTPGPCSALRACARSAPPRARVPRAGRGGTGGLRADLRASSWLIISLVMTWRFLGSSGSGPCQAYGWRRSTRRGCTAADAFRSAPIAAFGLQSLGSASWSRSSCALCGLSSWLSVLFGESWMPAFPTTGPRLAPRAARRRRAAHLRGRIR